MALVLGTFYFDQPQDQKGVANMNSVMFITLIALTFLNMIAVVNVSLLETKAI